MITVLIIGLITLGLFLAQRELYHKYWNHRVYASVAFESDGIACGEPSAVIEVVENAPEIEPISDSKKELWKFVIQIIISILTAVLTALGATSCVAHM